MMDNIVGEKIGRMALFVFLAGVITGCSTPNIDETGVFNVDTGSHPAGWTVSHPVFVSPDAGECTPCHGDTLDGGVASLSCLTSDCHHGTISSWASPTEHGESAKSATKSQGFLSCQVCHGNDFSGGFSGSDCFFCHTTAPHPANWLSGDFYSHAGTVEENAPACAGCHTGGDNSPNPPPPAPAPGEPPGCFNNTLCHGADISHPAGWASPDSHGVAAKGQPGSLSGFISCQPCHGVDFAGNTAASCLDNGSCHGTGVLSPHSPNWIPLLGDTRDHTTTNEGNAIACGRCHYDEPDFGYHSPSQPPANDSGCFNSTLCHVDVAGGTHSVNWLNRDDPSSFHSTFDSEISCETAKCHAPAEVPNCGTCHFDNQGSRVSGSFTHTGSVISNHRSGSLASVGNICENCHQTNRTFSSSPISCSAGGGSHPANDGCHYDSATLDPVFTNPRY